MNELATRPRIQKVLCELGARATGPGAIDFVGRKTAVLDGRRETTLAVDLKLHPEPGGILEIIQTIKHKLGINIKLAAPDEFVPVLPVRKARSPFIAGYGKVDFHYYDPNGQVLAKLERGTALEV